MAEAVLISCGKTIDWVADAAYSGGDVIQLRDGRAGVVTTDVESGKVVGVYVEGIFDFVKPTGMVLLKGGRVYWDHSANKVHFSRVNDRDFFLGALQEDVASTTLTAEVALNVKPHYDLTFGNSGLQSIPIQTAGFPAVISTSTGATLLLQAATEAQKVDAMTSRGMGRGALGIVEAIVTVVVDLSGAAVDFNVGLADGTHATDADQIVTSLFMHLDGGSTNITLESDDGTTEVAATDTTVDYVVGTPFEVWFDCRNNADIQVYVDGALVLGSTVFKLDAGTTVLRLLAHLEKSTGTTVANVSVDFLGARMAQV